MRSELGASIADAIEARIEQGEGPAAAERAVLTELGDPAVLAADCADRPLHLIGPRYYLTWWRLLKTLLIIAPLCALGGVAIAQALVGSPVETIIAEALAIALSAAVHVCFWVTLMFVVLERTGSETSTTWDVDHLPQEEMSDTRLRDVVASLALLVVAAAAILWDSARGFAVIQGETVPLLHPQLWPWWMAALFVLLAMEAVIAVAVWITGRWTVPLAAVNTATAVLVISWTLILLGRGRLVNPAFTEALFGDQVADAAVVRILGVLLGVGVVAIAAWDATDRWLKARRAVGAAGTSA